MRGRWVRVTADGSGLTSHAGSLLLAELADRSGLTDGLSVAMAYTAGGPAVTTREPSWPIWR